jgi:hypothetical protein
MKIYVFTLVSLYFFFNFQVIAQTETRLKEFDIKDMQGLWHATEYIKEPFPKVDSRTQLPQD